MASTKNFRMAVRLTSEQDTVIRRAAELQGASITEFTVAATVSHARDVLANQRVFTLDPATFAEFEATLNRPATHKPYLEKLFARESVFED